MEAGGFPPLEVSEDVALVHALMRIGARIEWSARTDFRAREGFGATLMKVSRQYLTVGTDAADSADTVPIAA